MALNSPEGNKRGRKRGEMGLLLICFVRPGFLIFIHIYNLSLSLAFSHLNLSSFFLSFLFSLYLFQIDFQC